MTETLSPVMPTSMELGEIVQEVWASFLDGELLVDPRPRAASGYDGKIVAWVAIGGDWTGHLMVITGQDCARQIAANMFMMDAPEVSTAEIADALGEIANMVGGSIKGMAGVPATLSLPQVVLDAAALVSPEARKVVAIDAQWNGEPLEFSLWERSAGNGSDAVRNEIKDAVGA